VHQSPSIPMSSTFSSSRNSPGSARLQLQFGAVRSSSLKKPPEPLRRAVADCLSSAAVATSHHGISPATSTDASRTLLVSV